MCSLWTQFNFSGPSFFHLDSVFASSIAVLISMLYHLVCLYVLFDIVNPFLFPPSSAYVLHDSTSFLMAIYIYNFISPQTGRQ